MEEIKVGEYVRTKKGKIFKYGKGRAYLGKDNEILNHSFNIKELIEEGDIVNESLIVYKGKVASGKEKLLVGNHIINGMPLEVANIKTILTKEQYERNCYRLENNEC